LTSNAFWKTVGFSPVDHSLATRISCALPELQCHHCSTNARLLFFTDCMLSPSTTLELRKWQIAAIVLLENTVT
jgi:hypothetical protein